MARYSLPVSIHQLGKATENKCMAGVTRLKGYSGSCDKPAEALEGWHQNIYAKWLVAATLIAPDFVGCLSYDSRWLFASPKEDPLYNRLLELRSKHRGIGQVMSLWSCLRIQTLRISNVGGTS